MDGFTKSNLNLGSDSTNRIRPK